MNKKLKTVQRRSIAFPVKQLEQLEKLAAKENQDVSKIVRKAVDSRGSAYENLKGVEKQCKLPLKEEQGEQKCKGQS